MSGATRAVALHASVISLSQKLSQAERGDVAANSPNLDKLSEMGLSNSTYHVDNSLHGREAKPIVIRGTIPKVLLLVIVST